MDKIAFVVCVNDQKEYGEILANIKALRCPANVERVVAWLQALEYNSAAYKISSKLRKCLVLSL